MTQFWKPALIGALAFLPALLTAQKVAFVKSERIRIEYEKFKEAEGQLQVDVRKAQFEYQTMATRLDSLKKAFDSQRLMSSPEWKREREKEITQLEKQVEEFQVRKVGPEGELYQKQAQVEGDLIQRVQKAVNKVAIDKGYDLVLDSMALLYAKPTSDITDDVLHELRRQDKEGTSGK